MRQVGMYSFTGLTEDQIDFLSKEYHIYISSDGYNFFSSTPLLLIALSKAVDLHISTKTCKLIQFLVEIEVCIAFAGGLTWEA